MPLLLEIVTPEKTAYSETVDSVVLPSESGELGILPGHIPLLTLVRAGELRVEKGGHVDYLAVDKGFVEVLGDKVSVLTEQAIDIENIDLNSIEEARERAEKALHEAREKGEDPAAVEEAETVLRFSAAQKLLKQRRR